MSEKGFFCKVIDKQRIKCLGPGKGRMYPPMDEQSKESLRSFYKIHNIALHKLLKKIGKAAPKWLQNELSQYG